MNKKTLESLLDRWIVPIILLIVIAVGIAYMVYSSIPQPVQHRAENTTYTAKTFASTTTPFKNLSLEASSVYVYDLKYGKVLFEKNAYEKRPLASIAKLMTAVVASERITDQTIITINKENLLLEGNGKLKEGEHWSFKNLLDFSLVVSSNDAASAIASAVGPKFIDIMNMKARQVGLSNTNFLNETGLDIDEKNGGAYGSARDVSLLVEYIINNHPQILEATRYENISVSSDIKTYEATNTNSIIGNIPNVIGSKTGFTDLSGGNLVTIFDVGLGHPVIAVVLGSSFEGRFNDISAIANATLLQFSEN